MSDSRSQCLFFSANVFLPHPENFSAVGFFLACAIHFNLQTCSTREREDAEMHREREKDLVRGDSNLVSPDYDRSGLGVSEGGAAVTTNVYGGGF